MTAAVPTEHRLITVICVPGTFEETGGAQVTGMLSFVTGQLAARFVCQQAKYPAAYGLPVSEGVSVQAGVTNVVEMIRRAPNPVMLLGYSQGAQVVRMVLADVAAGLHPDLQVVAAGLIADPWREPGVANGPQVVRSALAGWGVAGPGSELPENVPVFEIARPGDVICDADGDSPLRAVADWTQWMSVTDPVAWWSAVQAELKRRKWQQVRVNWRNPVATWLQFSRASRDVAGYLSGAHTCYAYEQMPGAGVTYCSYLASVINNSVF